MPALLSGLPLRAALFNMRLTEKSMFAISRLCVQGYLGALHMSPVDRAGSVTEIKLLSVHMVSLSPLSEMKIMKKW